jgi:maltose alpha-D-glucosyltransferase / alpha-amylase
VAQGRRDPARRGECLPDESAQYFGENGGTGIHMMFNFFVNQHLFYALATEDVGPLIDAIEATQEIPATSQWAQFLRNHDELDLGRLSDEQRRTSLRAVRA